jgi:hypothetical protein
MIDMLRLVKRYYYHPSTNGSNSLKYVLPAVLNSSEYLQHKYARPIYGTPDGIKSHNYSGWIWVRRDAQGSVIDPYQLLPPIHSRHDDAILERLFGGDDIREGGAAMTAYARMQYTEMESVERDRLTEALLKYCELDTLAMVMLFEHWRSLGVGQA